jgi:xanthine/CO dehydrogenase XdhC/CoxF family maturation factor
VKELFEIIDARRQQPAIPHAVATVLRVEGSSYRRPGARMLLNIHGRVAGSISGGCLEKAVISEGRRALMDGRPRLLAYDTTDQDDLALGTSLGCQGKIWIGLEVLPAHSAWALEAIADGIRQRRKFAALVTRVCGEGKSLHFERDLIFEEESDAADEAVQEALLHHKTSFQMSRDGFGSLVEFLAPPLSLFLFGAGPDVLPMIRLARQLGHEITVVDRRPEFARVEDFPGAREVLALTPCQLGSALRCDDHTVAVLMNHHYDTDRDVLAALIPLGLPYLAMLGPKKRTSRILDELRAEGHDVDAVAETLHGPAGLDIGAESPEQIALAILAEIQATLSHRNGGKLRHRKAPIHSDASTLVQPPCAVLA